MGAVVGGVAGFGAYALTHRGNFDGWEAARWGALGALAGGTLGIAVEAAGAAGLIGVGAAEADMGGYLLARTQAIHSTLDPVKQDRTTTAVLRAMAPDGTARIVIGFSENSLRPVQRAALLPGEIAAQGKGHAEVTALNYALRLGFKPLEIAASRPICSACADEIFQIGAKPVSPLK